MRQAITALDYKAEPVKTRQYFFFTWRMGKGKRPSIIFFHFKFFNLYD